MKTNRFFLWCIAFMVCVAIQANAMTLAEISGTYLGWRAITTPAETILFIEADQIRPDGRFDTLLIDVNGNVQQQSSILTLDANGNITGPSTGILNIQGGTLHNNYQLDADRTMQVMTERFADDSFVPPSSWQNQREGNF